MTTNDYTNANERIDDLIAQLKTWAPRLAKLEAEARAATVSHKILIDRVAQLEAVTTDNAQNVQGLAREQDISAALVQVRDWFTAQVVYGEPVINMALTSTTVATLDEAIRQTK
jgi:hypothetical protein